MADFKGPEIAVSASHATQMHLSRRSSLAQEFGAENATETVAKGRNLSSDFRNYRSVNEAKDSLGEEVKKICSGRGSWTKTTGNSRQ